MSATPPAPPKARDDQPRALLPTFTPPPPPTEEPSPPDQPETSATTTEEEPRGLRTATRSLRRAGLLESPEPSTRAAATPTETSSASRAEVSLAEATGLIVGLLGVVITVAGVIVRWQAKRRLREPNATERRNIATPLARIAKRHTDLSMFGEDVGDVLQLAAATGAYLGNGPLLQPLDRVDPGVPADLNQTEES